MFEQANLFLTVAGMFLTIFAAVWSLAWWLSGEFTKMRSLIYAQIEKLGTSIFQKLNYHEKHDDQRFQSIDNRFLSLRDDMWEMKMRNAAVKGVIMNSKGPNTRVVQDLQEHFKDEFEKV